MYSLIVSGGSGTRLWPISRATNPKQLFSFNGSDNSLLQDTFVRMMRTVAPERIRIVTNRDYGHQVLEQVRQIAPDYPEENLLCEPTGKDSAPAILWGALQIAREAPGAVASVVWSDHLIRGAEAFDDAMIRAAEAARQGGLFAVGVTPTFPDPGLGYIKAGEAIADGVFAVDEFIEKPPLAQAERMLAEGGYSWNAGLFVFNLATLLAEFERLAPDMMAAFREGAGPGENPDWRDDAVIERVYAGLHKESIDYAILEKTDQLRVVPCALDWNDLGSWNAVHQQAPKDRDGNVTQGNVCHLGTRGSYIRGGKRLVAAVGVENLVIVDTEDALLVCSMDKVQEVKELVALLREQGHPEAVNAATTVRPWGSFTVLNEGPGFKVKFITVKPKQRLSLQAHRQRAEHWMVKSGQALATLADERIVLGPGEHLHIPMGAKHRLENTADQPLEIVEVQFGGYLGEDDIVRFEDNYGRA